METGLNIQSSQSLSSFQTRVSQVYIKTCLFYAFGVEKNDGDYICESEQFMPFSPIKVLKAEK